MTSLAQIRSRSTEPRRCELMDFGRRFPTNVPEGDGREFRAVSFASTCSDYESACTWLGRILKMVVSEVPRPHSHLILWPTAKAQLCMAELAALHNKKCCNSLWFVGMQSPALIPNLQQHKFATCLGSKLVSPARVPRDRSSKGLNNTSVRLTSCPRYNPRIPNSSESSGNNTQTVHGGLRNEGPLI